MGRLLSIVETANRLGLTEQTLRNWIKEGYISVKSVGKARYIDEDAVIALQDTVEDINRQKSNLDAILVEIRNDYEKKKADFIEEETRSRYINLVCGAAFRSSFFASMVHLMVYCDTLKEREGEILVEYLNGYTLSDIARRYDVSRERIRQIVEKAIRKSSDLERIENRIREIEDLETKNRILKAIIEDQRVKLSKYENNKTPDEKDKQETIALYGLLTRKLIDCPLSIRALNCLKGGSYRDNIPSCETVGDLCKMSKDDVMRIRNFGRKTLIELDDFLESLNLSWKMDVEKIYNDYAMIES